MLQTLMAVLLPFFIATKSLAVVSPIVGRQPIATHEISMSRRYADPFVSNVFKENILLTIAYGRGIAAVGKPVDWKLVDEPFHWTFTIEPDQVLSYHDTLLSQYEGARVFTPAHFWGEEGFKSDGWLIGDGTCQLASLMRWVAEDSHVAVEARVNHDFAAIPEVPKAMGVSIFSKNAEQNLYIKNTSGRPIEFSFDYSGEILRVSTYEL